MTQQANWFTTVTVRDPDTGLDVEVSMYKHQNGGIFGIDGSYDEQVVDEEKPIIQDPLNDEGKIELLDILES